MRTSAIEELPAPGAETLRRTWSRRGQEFWHSASPPQLFVTSFLLLVLLGTLGLRLVPWFYTGRSLTWMEALFTSTSAVCVTGLIVVDTATFFTLPGQAFLLLLIQLGGLGMITFTSLIIAALGKRLSLKSEELSFSGMETLAHLDPRRLTRRLVISTLAIEAAGALILYVLWGARMGWATAAWPSVFHSVSAFCNAGFSTYTDSLIGFQESPATLFVIGLLIVLGGLGFAPMAELATRMRKRRSGIRYRLSLHTRLVLVLTGALLAGGWALFAIFEWHNTLAGLPVADRLANGLFLSVTARTAGFNSIDYGRAGDNTNFLTVLLMQIGGSPGSTAGGLKTTTFALIGLVAWSRLRGLSTVTVWGRSVPEETVQRAIGLFVVMAAVFTAAVFILTSVESNAQGPGSVSFLAYVFEAASALNTVGVSMGLTAGTTTAGRWLLILLMFVGRVGPLTFAAAIALKKRKQGGVARYAYEDVAVG